MELHIITVCVLLLALEPLEKTVRQIRNWSHRRAAHRAHLKRQL